MSAIRFLAASLPGASRYLSLAAAAMAPLMSPFSRGLPKASPRSRKCFVYGIPLTTAPTSTSCSTISGWSNVKLIEISRRASCPQSLHVLVLDDPGRRRDRRLHNIREWLPEIFRTLADRTGWCESACKSPATRRPTQRNAERHHGPTRPSEVLSHILRSTASPHPPLGKILAAACFALAPEHRRPTPLLTKRLPQPILVSLSFSLAPDLIQLDAPR